jgi:class 3 adenylate cyclase/tetratricopeptide (TPR) repeat protein
MGHTNLPDEYPFDWTTQLIEDALRQAESYRKSAQLRVVTILFGDQVGSTAHASHHNNLEGSALRNEFRALYKEQVEHFEGAHIEYAGDGVLAIFASPTKATLCALHLHSVLRGHEEFPSIRVGIHMGEIVVSNDGILKEVYGRQVNACARMMDLAEGGRTLISPSILENATANISTADTRELKPLEWRDHGRYRFHGVETPAVVCEVAEEGTVKPLPPANSTKAWRADEYDEYPGWRPGPEVVVPGTNWVLEERLGRQEISDPNQIRFQGEFGQVWKAFNSSLSSDDHKAYKVFKFCFSKNQVPALKREARLLMKLREHPHDNLIQEVDVFVDQDGPPHYLTMEYVEGPSLASWLATEPSLEERLDLIAQVAGALEVVHRAGIFHRDIKPSNILLMLQTDGSVIPKLTDFGLGAATDRKLLNSAYASKSDNAAGTWDYIAPELKAAAEEGEHKATPSPESDLYSLGLTLFQLVTGDLTSLPVGNWDARVPTPELRDDIADCLAQAPGQRPKSAEELAERLRNHDKRTQARRFRRLRRLTVLITIVAIVALCTAVFSAYQWHRAEQQKRRAEMQNSLAMDAIATITYDLPRLFGDIPGTTEALHQLFEKNGQLIQKLLDTEGENSRVVHGEWATLLTLAEGWRALGDSEQAVSVYRVAIAALEKRGMSRLKKQELSRTYFELGDTYNDLGHREQALSCYEEAQTLLLDVISAGVADQSSRQWLIDTAERIGNTQRLLSNDGASDASYRKALKLLDQFSDQIAVPQASEDTQIFYYSRLGDIQNALGQANAAVSTQKRVLKLLELQLALNPTSSRNKADLATAHERLGDLHWELGHKEHALAAYEESHKLRDGLVQLDTDNYRLLLDLSVASNRLGDMYRDAGRHEEALAKYEKSSDEVRLVVEKDPKNTQALGNQGMFSLDLGDSYEDLGRIQDALVKYELARDSFERILDSVPDDVEAQEELRYTYNGLADIYINLDRLEEARSACDISRTLLTALAESTTKSAERQRPLAHSFVKLGDTYKRIGEIEESLSLYATAHEFFKQLGTISAGSNQDLRELSLSYYRLADTNEALNHSRISLQLFNMALETFQQLPKKERDTAKRQHYLAGVHTRLGKLNLQMGRTESSLTHYQAAQEVYSKLALEQPHSDAAALDLAMNRIDLGLGFFYNGDDESAARHMRAAFEHQHTDNEVSVLVHWCAETRLGNTDSANRLIQSYLKGLGENERSAWYGRLAAFLLGQLDHAALLDFARSGLEEHAPGMLCEAYFYAGFIDLLAGDLVAAKTSFEQCLATGKESYFEFRAARHELERIRAPGSGIGE